MNLSSIRNIIVTQSRSLTKWCLPLFTVSLLSLAGCNYHSNLSGMHYFLGMHDMHAIEAQEEDNTTLNVDMSQAHKTHGMDQVVSWAGPGTGLRTPPEGSVPRGVEPYPYGPNDFDAAAGGLKNPLPKTKAVLERGQKEFNTYCSVCHGVLADGKGAVTPRFAGVPSLLSEKIRNWEDGRIFHMITMGRARMKPFAAQIAVNDRWAIIHYLRLLQKKAGN